MQVLEATDTSSPRSALRHRPLTTSPKHSVVTTATHPVTQRASRVRPKAADDELVSEWQRGESEELVSVSQTRYASHPPTRRSSRTTAPQPAPVRRWRAHPLLFLSLGMLAMLAFWMLLSAGLNWWNETMDTLHYGFPRIYQVDVAVGHDDSLNQPSHFLATNLHGHIEIIEFPGGDGAHARIFLGPQLFGLNAEKAPVTLTFADVNGDHRPDMLVFFQSSWIVFINDQGSFRSPTVQERQGAAEYLSAHGQL